MPFIVVDYREVYHVLLNEEPVPQNCRGKFVLIARDNEQFAVFSPEGMSRYHANIVDRFFSLRGINGHYNKKGDHFEPRCFDWQIHGGGHWELNEPEGTLAIFGCSEAYGEVDLQDLANLLRKCGGVGRCEQIVVA